MHKLALALAILAVSSAFADAPKTATIAIPSNTTAAVTSVTIGDSYRYGKEIDAVKIVLSGKTDTNILLVATVGQNMAGYTNTVTAVSFASSGTSFSFPRNIITTNHLECFTTDAATFSYAFVWATNTAVAATLTNAVSVSATVFTK